MSPHTIALAEHFTRLLEDRNWTLATAESCTGGLLSATLTQQPGASKTFIQGFTCYGNMGKMEFLNVQHQTLVDHGAVSEAVAVEMAEGAAAAARTDIGLGLTGVAGPGGGTHQKPVGLVYAAINLRGTSQTQCWTFPGNRQEIREAAVKGMLSLAGRAFKNLDSLGRH